MNVILRQALQPGNSFDWCATLPEHELVFGPQSGWLAGACVDRIWAVNTGDKIREVVIVRQVSGAIRIAQRKDVKAALRIRLRTGEMISRDEKGKFLWFDLAAQAAHDLRTGYKSKAHK